MDKKVTYTLLKMCFEKGFQDILINSDNETSQSEVN